MQASHNWQSVRSIADKVLNTRVEDPEQEKAARFVYHVCRNYRHESQARGLPWDAPNDYHKLSGESVEKLSGQFLFEQCRRFKYEIFSDAGRWMHQAGYDIMACTMDRVACKKHERQCLGSCSGVDNSLANHDFATTVSLTELSEFVLGDAFDDGAAADCTVRSYVFQVPTFAGGDGFKTFAARLAVRSGMTAIDREFLQPQRRELLGHPARAGAQKQLAFVNGEFRHVYSTVPPSPPPPPNPPPRTFRYGPDPPAPSPPPGSPPPYYAVRCAPRLCSRMAGQALPVCSRIAGQALPLCTA